MSTPNEQLEMPVKRKIALMMRKVRSDSPWNGLTFEQCETVEKWLFDEHVSYPETAVRIQKEFGKETSEWSVGRFYRTRARVRRALELLDAQVDSDQMGRTGASTGEMRELAVKLLAKNAVTLATERPENMEGLRTLTKTLLDSEENEIRLRRVKLEERHYDLRANRACAEDLVKVRAYLRAIGDNEHLTPEEKQERVMALLFGREKVDMELPRKRRQRRTKKAHDCADGAETVRLSADKVRLDAAKCA
jgi:hypothetical protein